MRYFRSPHHQTVMYAVLVAIVMLTPGAAVPSMPRFDWLDKSVHLLTSFGMTWFLSRSLRVAERTRLPGVVAAICSLAYAIVLETLQIVIPGRDWDIGDLIASAVGVALAVPLQSVTKRG